MTYDRSIVAARRLSGIKWCWKCKSEKPVEDFSRSKSRSDGFDAKCKKCNSDYQFENKKKLAAGQRNRRQSTREHDNEQARRRYNPIKEAERRGRRDQEPIRKARRKWFEDNRELANTLSRDAKRRKREISRESDRIYRENNQEKIKKKNKEYRSKNKDKMRAASARYRKANPGKFNARTARRTAALLQATPSWVDFDVIEKFYIEAARLTRETGIVYEVDHIYPLRGKICCGFHVPWNLQVITRTENRSKQNKMPEGFT